MQRTTDEYDKMLINTLERVYPGWHVWISDEYIWYATWRGMPDWQTGGEAWTPNWLVDELHQPCTVWGRNPSMLDNELAAEDSARMRRMLARSPEGQFTRETLDGCIHQEVKKRRGS